ncbi:thiamine pyrophosphate-requiring protein [Nitratireductor aestuarii]|uniref:thiamine pyrophosphate-requiring protein n=1 Tax=Nitratireductor aestuarii TaxID=1735103 RepID=UPI00166D7E58|nr:thiamine pyrophosphate-requiring protein [Nitratireductor aestuarii]
MPHSPWEEKRVKVGEAIIEILKREGVEMVIGYPVNHLLEHAAEADVRPIIVRQERTGIHMADAISRLSSGEKIGVFVMQLGPGTENSYGGIAQAYGESVPVLVMPGGYPRRLAHIEPNYNASISMRDVTKSAEPINVPADIPNILRRAFSRLRNGVKAPVLVEIPNDIWNEEVPGPLNYRPVVTTRSGPDPKAVVAAVDLLLEARKPVLYAGQGIHYAKAWPQLRALAERLAIPVCTSLEGKSAFPEDHPLALGAGGAAVPLAVRQFLDQSDVIFGIGCSFTETSFGVAMPRGKRVIHGTLAADHINKDIEAEVALVGDAALILEAMLAELERRGTSPRSWTYVADEIARVRAAWLKEWMPKLTSNEAPLSPYRVLWDLQKTVDVANTIITHDAGSPRDQLSPFWVSKEPLTYIGWGKTTQLGYGLGLAMGAKLAHPEKLCINVWGDAAIGFTGMDFETAVRERIPILSVLLNNFSMAMELPIMEAATKKYRATDISGNYAQFAAALGGYGERITRPEDIVPAIRRGIEQTQRGVPVLLEFITCKELAASRYHSFT